MEFYKGLFLTFDKAHFDRALLKASKNKADAFKKYRKSYKEHDYHAVKADMVCEKCAKIIHAYRIFCFAVDAEELARARCELLKQPYAHDPRYYFFLTHP